MLVGVTVAAADAKTMQAVYTGTISGSYDQ
jgi:hypothetical protein